MATQLTMKLTADESLAPDAVLGPCPVGLCQPGSAGHSQAHYHFSCLDNDTSSKWGEVLMDSRMQQYTDLCE